MLLCQSVTEHVLIGKTHSAVYNATPTNFSFQFLNEGKIYERAQPTNNNRVVIREQIPATMFSFSFTGDPSSKVVCVFFLCMLLNRFKPVGLHWN